MKNKSSNDIDQNIKQLENIQKVAAPEDLYQKIREKIDNNKMISWQWVKLAAAVFVGCLFLDGYVILSLDYNTDGIVSESTSLIPLETNQLYYE
jgi:quinol-cytochrome oxidoreductase complex cytochrome b subunit